MTDDRSIERVARSWLEDGPTRAPDYAIESALLRVQTTTQERDLRVPWRDRPMTMTARLVAAAIAIAVVAIGGAVLFKPASQPNVGGPSPTPTITSSPFPSTDALAALRAYRTARDAICVPASQQLATLNAASEAAMTPSEQADVVASIIVLGTTETDQLAALEPPPALAEEHAADVHRHRDSLALLAQIEDLLRQGKTTEADAVDQALGAALSSQEEAFQQRYSLADCP